MIYQARCRGCGAEFDYSRTVDQRHDVPPCPRCGQECEKVILSAPMGVVTGKFEPFRSMIDGSLISNQRDLEQHNKRHNVALLNDGYSDEGIKQLAEKAKNKPAIKVEGLAEDLAEATKAVSSGYTPNRQVLDDE